MRKKWKRAAACLLALCLMAPAHAAGTYHVTVDVETLAYEAKLG